MRLPTYDGLAKHDLQEDPEEEVDQAWSQIASQAVNNVCRQLGWTLSTLEFRKTPSFWEPEHSWIKSLTRTLWRTAVIGPQPIAEGDFFPDALPLLEWLQANYAFVILGNEEPVLWAHFPQPEMFLGEIKKLSAQYGHQMMHGNVPFRSFKQGRIFYGEISVGQ